MPRRWKFALTGLLSGAAFLVFTPTVHAAPVTYNTSGIFVLGSIDYHISQDSTGIRLVAPASGGGITMLNGNIAANPSPASAPEPGTVLFLAAGLAGLAYRAWRTATFR
jgi:hypothetical protein